MENDLQNRCKVSTGNEGDRFVGVKADLEGIIVHFPIGYQLSNDNVSLRIDVRNLLDVLALFGKEDATIEMQQQKQTQTVYFPIYSYLKVITSFLKSGHYYAEKDPEYKTRSMGNVSWSKTFKKQRPLVQRNGSLIFTNKTVRVVSPNEKKQITQIHKFCVYEAFKKFGWLYVPFMPDLPGYYPGIKESIYILTKKLITTHNDEEQELFRAMKNILEYIDESSSEEFFFGTDYFEYIWERMIDKAFGIPDKNQYFPKTRWLLMYGKTKEKTPLYPDCVMTNGDRYYVLDAKYYRYGCTGDAAHLPNGADINKQITYGEYLEQKCNLPNEKLFNAFIMPYNKENNLFGLNSFCCNIGRAIGDWKANKKNYENIQGVLIDTKFLMQNYTTMAQEHKSNLIHCIECSCV